MTTIAVPVKRLPHSKGLPLPAFESAGAAGMDLLAAIESEIALMPGERVLIPTGLQIAIPEGYEGAIRPRSGLALRHGVTVLNAPGTIDADYRGEVGVILINHGKEVFPITRGMRIAQLVVSTCATVRWRETAELPETGRGEGGFGSTGVAAAKG